MKVSWFRKEVPFSNESRRYALVGIHQPMKQNLFVRKGLYQSSTCSSVLDKIQEGKKIRKIKTWEFCVQRTETKYAEDWEW